ncbi:DUF2750 domain-containing protein [Saccharophagus sp. K07]|jgi:hypothetical protein|uniref:DUF2750 domain-containing protein n=1 Tax=Saccharophagus sp. K07 TaxID=2283636 RepID=UPI0016527C89|nr:DUF2750 domain-containing protein [Saccharophagus sp. K07]MBC6906381.1 DUF2750 domain-containing protein [Saccharophagus sp. K07]
MSEQLGDDFDQNYVKFLSDAIETGCVWALESDEGFALCASINNEEIDVMPMWSQPEYAESHIEGEWKNYRAVPIALEELLEDWLPGMHEDLTLVGPNWNSDLEGDEVEPLDLLEDFEENLED